MNLLDQDEKEVYDNAVDGKHGNKRNDIKESDGWIKHHHTNDKRSRLISISVIKVIKIISVIIVIISRK